ncbi:ATP-binding protein [Kordia sp.]|uniref:ATP-binding protein n=1 Tax=Kordia sp. TaxID=1965332 RepID=UPI003D27E2C4
MNKLKRIGLYGISGTGKTTLLQELKKQCLDTICLEGSSLLLETANISLPEFKKLSDTQKYKLRENAMIAAHAIQETTQKHIIIDGHLVFAKSTNEFENVMTAKDAAFYTHYLYLKLPIAIIYERLQNDTTRKRNYTKEALENWMNYEWNALQIFCTTQNLPLNIIETTNKQTTVDFICNYLKNESI